MLTTELIRRGARWHRDKPAILFGEERMSFAEVDALSNRIGNALRDRAGLGEHEPVALLVDNGLLSIPLDFACVKARLVRVPLNGRLSLAEHRRMIEGLGVRHLIHSASQAERAHDLARELPHLQVLGEDLLSLARDSSDTDLALPAEPDDVIVALYTSGTTGTLKAAQHTQASYGAIAANILTSLVDPRPGEIMLHAASMIHASGTFVLPYWVRGGIAGVLPGFQPAEYLGAIRRWRPAALNLVPTMLAMLMEEPAFADADLSSIDTIVYGASPMPRPLIERALARFGPVFVQYYGQTEAPLAIAALGKQDHLDPVRLGACGRPSVDCELRLVDESGADAPPGEPGEIALRAPFMMKGYRDAEELNAQTFLPGGWLRTRDVGRFDEEGYLHLVDRTSDMIVTGGYNVYPREVEDVLAGHEAVREVAVVGLPDDRWGESVTAFVVVRSEAREEELIAHARASLAGYKVPKSVRFIDAIPKSAIGKPLRRALRKPFWHGKDRRI